jgi:seryl-tRNA synthetase
MELKIMNHVSNKTVKSIEKFVDNLSLKLGYVSKENMTYLEQLKREFYNSKKEITENMKQFRDELEKFIQKLKVSSSEKDDFKEEMKQFLVDSVEDLMSQGYSEEEALKRALEQFGDEHSLEVPLEVNDKQNSKGWESMKQEAIGLFYAAGLFLGGGAGAAIGFLYHHLLFGAAFGVIIGVGLGLLSNAIIALKQN